MIGEGCSFCRRYGMPLLPVRPAVFTKEDRLLSLPASITVPVSAAGETDYTARLLRQGFLYIWCEKARYWINYFATGDGYYYPLPENGSVTPRVASVEIKPCITQPGELATASLITLPILPAHLGMNGVYWLPGQKSSGLRQCGSSMRMQTGAAGICSRLIWIAG